MKYKIPLGRCYWCRCGWCSKRHDSQKCYYSATNCYKCIMTDDYKKYQVHTCDYFVDKTTDRVKQFKRIEYKRKPYVRDIKFYLMRRK